MKKFILLLTTIVLLFGCSIQPTPTQPFDQFIEETTDVFLEGTTSFNLNFIYNNSKHDGQYFGFGFVSEEDWAETMQIYKDTLARLRRYNYKKLTPSQQVVYTAVENYLERQLVMEDYYYYENPYFGSYSSVMQELPLLIQMYTFNDIEDVENYFRNLAAFKDDFINSIDFEKARQEKGVGYSQKIIDDTKKQVQEIIDEGGVYLTQYMNNVILGLDFLTDEQKAYYVQKNTTAIVEDFIGAYEVLLDGLNTIEGKSENVSIKDRDYYAAVIYYKLGIRKSVPDIKDDLSDSYEVSYDTLVDLLLMNPELMDEENIYDIPYCEFSDAQSGLNYLKTKIFTIVPEITNLSYDIYIVPESLQEGFAPAAYLSPKIDMTEDQKECIMLNPSSSSANLFPTLVHEGYPGHMYQNTYLRLKDYPDIMCLIDCIGYSEGWAIYIENRSSEFLEENASWQKLLQANDLLSSIVLAYIDIGIHYEGWDYEDCVSFYNECMGTDITDELQGIYDIVLQNPGYYLYYIYSGEFIHGLYEDSKEQLGDKFNEIEFHQVILDSGCVGLDIVEQNVNNYIKSKK